MCSMLRIIYHLVGQSIAQGVMNPCQIKVSATCIIAGHANHRHGLWTSKWHNCPDHLTTLLASDCCPAQHPHQQSTVYLLYVCSCLLACLPVLSISPDVSSCLPTCASYQPCLVTAITHWPVLFSNCFVLPCTALRLCCQRALLPSPPHCPMTTLRAPVMSSTREWGSRGRGGGTWEGRGHMGRKESHGMWRHMGGEEAHRTGGGTPAKAV